MKGLFPQYKQLLLLSAMSLFCGHGAAALELAASAGAPASDPSGVLQLRALDPSLNGAGVSIALADATGWVNPASSGQSASKFSYVSDGNVTATAPGAYGSHANAVSAYMVGTGTGGNPLIFRNSMAPGIGAFYSYDLSLETYNVFGGIPLAGGVRIVSQPWGQWGANWGFTDLTNEKAYNQAYDNFAATQNVLFINSSGGADQTPASMFNGLCVDSGTTPNGKAYDGRVYKHLYYPVDTSSAAAGAVGGGMAVLLQGAQRGDGGADTTAASDARTLKVLALNGATKEFGWSNSSTVPLDAYQGAGMFNLFNSYTQLAGGKLGSGTMTGLAGWDLQSLSSTSADASKTYNFSLAADPRFPSITLTTTITWNRQAGQSDINHLTLELYDVDSGLLVPGGASLSMIDNLQMIYLPTIGAGNYQLRVNKIFDTSQVSAAETYALAFSAAGSYIFQNSGTQIWSNPMSGSLPVVKTGVGLLTLTGSNSYYGGTTISSGTLAISGSGTLGASTGALVISGGTLDLGSTAQTVGSVSITGAGGIQSGTLTGTSYAATNSTGTANVSAVLAGNGVNLTKSGAGTLVLAGANTYTGKSTVSGGILQFGKQTALYGGSSGSWTAANLNAQSGGTLAFNVGGTGEFTAADVTTLLNSLATSSSGTTGMNAGSSLGFDTTNASGGSFIISDGIANTTGSSGGARGLTKLGAGTLVLTGSSSYTGNTTISGGSLQIGSGGTTGALSTSSAITNNGSLVFNRSNTITAGADFKNGIGGTGNVTILGSGTVDLGSGNSFSGGLYIYNGTVIGQNTQANLGVVNGYIYLGQVGGTNNATVYNNRGSNDVIYNVVVQAADPTAILTIGKSNNIGGWNGTITLNHDVTLNNNVANNTQLFNSTISGSYGVIVANGGSGAVVALTGSNSYGGGTRISSGGLQLGNANALGSGTLSISGGSLDSSVANLVNAGNNAQAWNGDFTFVGTQNLHLGTGAVTLGANRNVTVTANTLTVGGGISGAFGLTKSGAGTLVLSGSNSYSGKTTLSGGVLQFGKQTALYGGANGSWTASNINAQSGGTLAFNVGGTGEFTTGDITTLLTNLADSSSATTGMNAGSALGFNTTNASGGTFTIANAIANTTGSSGGSRGLTKLGAGTLVLTAANTYTGNTIVSGGTLQIGNGGTTGSLSVSSAITNNGSLIFNRNDTITAGTDFKGGISGTGSVIVTGGGSVNFGAFASTFTGGLYIYSGTAVHGNTGGSLGPSGGSIYLGQVGSTNNATLNIVRGQANSTDVNYNIVVQAAGPSAILSIGKTTTAAGIQFGSLNGTVTLNHDLTLNSQLASSSHVINSAISGTGGLIVDSPGYAGNTVILAGTNTFTGGVTVKTGGLRVGNAEALNSANPNAMALSGTAATLDLNGFSISVGTLSGTAGAVITSNTTGTITLTASSIADSTYAGVIRSGSGTVGFTKAGAGTLTFSGSNGYTGATTISVGTLAISSTNGLAGTSGVSMSGGAALAYTGSAATFAKNITVSSGIGTVRNTGGGTLTLSGTLSKDGSILRLNGGSFNITGNIIGASAGSDLLVDAATVALSGSNSYNGPTYIINSGTLNASVANALPTANGRTDVSMDQSGSGNSVLSLGVSQSIASLTGAGTSTVTLGANTLTIGATSGTSTFAGVISGGGALTKDGNSVQVLSGNNTYTGVTNVNGGRLLVSGTLSRTAGITVDNGAELKVNGLVNTASTATINSGILSGSGTLGALVVKNGGTVSPGNSPGTLTVASAAFENGSVFKLEVSKDKASGGVAGSDWDKLAVLGLLDFSNVTAGGILLNLQSCNFGSEWDATINHSFDGFISFGSIAGFSTNQFTFQVDPLFAGTGTWGVVQSGSQLNVQYTATAAVPEPSSWLLLIFGFALAGRRGRRRC